MRLTVACVLAGAAAVAAGMPRPDWAVITAAMILHQGPDRVTGSWRAVHRCVGTVAGVALLAAVAAPAQHPVGLVLIVALLVAGTEAFLVVNYAIAMVFITPLAMILGELSTPTSTFEAALSRIGETLLGVAVAVAVLWAVAPRSHRTILVSSERRVAQAMAAVDTAAAPDVPARLRRLEYELHGATNALRHVAHADPGWIRRHWHIRQRAQAMAYRRLVALDDERHSYRRASNDSRWDSQP